MLKKIITILLVIVLSMSLTLTYASKMTVSLDKEIKKDTIEFLRENEVSEKDIKGLINKLENNILWDCYIQENLDKIPESFYTFDIDSKKTEQVRYFRFEDGSFVMVSSIRMSDTVLQRNEESNKFLKDKIKDEKTYNEIIKSNTNGFTTYAVEQGSGYAHYYNHYISKFIGAMRASMYTEFVVVNGGSSYLIPSGFYGPEAKGFGELGQMPVIEIVRQQEVVSTSQWALANSHWFTSYSVSTPWGGSTGSGTYYLWLGVGSSQYRVSDRLPY